jgi:hypothetical protein
MRDAEVTYRPAGIPSAAEAVPYSLPLRMGWKPIPFKANTIPSVLRHTSDQSLFAPVAQRAGPGRLKCQFNSRGNQKLALRFRMY